MKCFNQTRWNILNKYQKVAVACRYLALPYFSNIVVQTGLSRTDVHLALDHLTDMGCFKSQNEWVRTSDGWALVFRYDSSCSNSYYDMLIKELLEYD